MATDNVELLIQLSGGSKCTVGELAQAAQCSEITIRRQIYAGKIYTVKIGGRVYIPMETATLYLKGEKCDTVPMPVRRKK